MADAQTIWLVSKYITAARHGFESRLFAIAKEMRAAGRNPVIISSDSSHIGTFPDRRELYTRETVDGCDTWWIRTLKYRRTASLRRVLSWIDFELKLFLMPKRLLPRPDVIVAQPANNTATANNLNAYVRMSHKSSLSFSVFPPGAFATAAI